jgi:SAM-dependent methyltransferase
VPDYDWARLALLAAGQVDSSRRDVGDVLHPLAFAPALLTAGPTLALGLFMLLVWTLGRQASHRGLALAAESPTWGPISRASALDRAILPRASDLPIASDPPAWATTAGVETLRRMASVDQYNRWIFKALGKHIGTRILEVGCGIGNMTPFFLDAEDLTCIDVAPESVDLVRRLFAAHPQVSALAADVADPAIVGRLGPGRYDTAVCINVLEHVEADAAALRNLRALLRPGGKLVLFVPAGQYLYGRLDEALGHYRRYTVPSLRELARAQGLDVVDAYYMNVAGVPGWFLSSRLLRREAPPRGLLWLFNLLTPPLAWTEEKLRPPFGLSVVCIVQRPEAS